MKKIGITTLMLWCGFFLVAQSTWTAEKCLELKNITAVTASPDGSKVLYAAREAVMTTDRSEYINQVWMTDTKTGKQMLLTGAQMENKLFSAMGKAPKSTTMYTAIFP